MAKISLIRVDFRLIHGQVVAKWLKQVQATKIIIVNDGLAKDTVMSNIYRMSTPAGVKCSIVGIERFMAAWNKNQLGDGIAMILFKDVSTAHAVWKQGFPLPELQVGGLGAGPERKIVYQNIALNKLDNELIIEMNENFCVYFQATPDDRKMEYRSLSANISF